MEENQVWLTTSLFSSPANWLSTIKEALVPFIKLQSSFDEQNYYIIRFNNLQGENIQFSIYTSNKRAEALSIEIDSYFKSYFLKANFSNEQDLSNSNGIFLPFPRNTIQYGLYQEPKDPEQKKTEIILTRIILTALLDETIDEETYLIFSFYLHVGSLKPILNHRSFQEVKSFISFLCAEVDNNNTLDSNLIEHKDDFIEIFSDILFKTSNELNLPWLSLWYTHCESQFAKINDIAAYYRTISNSINHQLSISESINMFVQYAIKQCLTANSPTLRST